MKNALNCSGNACITSRVLTAIQLEKVESLSEIMKHKVMATPAVVVDNIVVHTGGIPSRDIIESWL